MRKICRKVRNKIPLPLLTRRERFFMNEKVSDEKLQKVLARAGFGSRREIEGWISEGRIKINNRVATLGDRVSENDQLEVDGRRVHHSRLKQKRSRVLIYHKPVGEVCSRSDPEGRETIFTNLPPLSAGRWISVGRLDLNTSGLLLITTDGELANKLMHPSQEVEREYAVRVRGEVDPDMLKRLLQGVELEDGLAHFDNIIDVGGDGSNHWYHVILHEGRNREVRRLWESQGVQVSRLMRVRYGNISLPRGQKPGRWEDLPEDAVEQLQRSVGLEPVQPSASSPSSKKAGSFSAARARGKSSPGVKKPGVKKKAAFSKTKTRTKTRRGRD